MVNAPIHSRQQFNRNLFHAGRQSVMWPITLSFVWLCTSALVGYQHVISLSTQHHRLNGSSSPVLTRWLPTSLWGQREKLPPGANNPILFSSTLTHSQWAILCGQYHVLWFLLFSMCKSLNVAVNKCINQCFFLHLYRSSNTYVKNEWENNHYNYTKPERISQSRVKM